MKKDKTQISTLLLRCLGIILLLLPFISTFYGDFASDTAGDTTLSRLLALGAIFTPIAIGASLMIYKSTKSVSLPTGIKWLAYALPASVLYVITNFINNFSK